MAVSFNFQRFVSYCQAGEPLPSESVQSHGLVCERVRDIRQALTRERLHPRTELLDAAAYKETRESARSFTPLEPQASEFTTNPLVEADKLLFTASQLTI
jgi:hypothetical protein